MYSVPSSLIFSYSSAGCCRGAPWPSWLYIPPQIEASDFAPEMVAQLQAKVSARKLHAQITVSQRDMQSLPAEWAGKFDAVFCNCAIMFVPDRIKAFQEMNRCVCRVWWQPRGGCLPIGEL